MKRIIMISGKQGSGKSTYAGILQRALIAKVFKFADPLYALHDKCLHELKVYGIRPWGMKKDGELLQVLGTEYGRNKIGTNVWVDVCRKRITDFHTANPNSWVLIDDCRFPNEFDAFPDAHRIRLNCGREARKERCSYWREDEYHASEIGLDDYEAQGKFDILVNTGASVKPETQIIEIIKQLGMANRAVMP